MPQLYPHSLPTAENLTSDLPLQAEPQHQYDPGIKAFERRLAVGLGRTDYAAAGDSRHDLHFV